jgi:hypothetical protein
MEAVKPPADDFRKGDRPIMAHWRTQTEHWLSSEEQGLDDAADAAFAQVFSALPAADPSPDFVQRTAAAAWRARARERRIVAAAGLAASILIVFAAAAAGYGLFDVAGGWLLTTAATTVTNASVSVIVAVTTAVQWWFATARAGSAVAGIMATPQSAVALLGIELVGIVALYMLQRLLRSDIGFRGQGTLCV